MITRSLSPITDSIKQDELKGISHDKTKTLLSKVLKKEQIRSTYKWSNPGYLWSDDQPRDILESMTLENKDLQNNKWINWHEVEREKYNNNEIWIDLNRPKQKPILKSIPNNSTGCIIDDSSCERYNHIIILLATCRHYHLSHAYEYSKNKKISIKEAKKCINARFDKALYAINNTNVYDFNNNNVLNRLSMSKMWILYSEDEIFTLSNFSQDEINRFNIKQKAIDDYDNRNLIYMKERNERMATEIVCLTQLVDLYEQYHN